MVVAPKYEPGAKGFHQTLLPPESGDPLRSGVGQRRIFEPVLSIVRTARPIPARVFGAKDKREACLSVKAGVNIQLPEPDCYLHLAGLVRKGQKALKGWN
jgi:hypothetical protein